MVSIKKAYNRMSKFQRHKNKIDIFKVEVPLNQELASEFKVIISNYDGRFKTESVWSDNMKKSMRGALKAYFYGQVVKNQLNIDWSKPAPWQNW